MMTEERTRFEVLLEDIQTQVRGIAEAQGGLSQRIDRMEARFEHRFDVLATKVDGLEVFALDTQRRLNGLEGFALDTQRRLDGLEGRFDGLEGRFDGLEGFALDTQRRVKRIETHLQLNGANPRHKAKANPARKRGRKA
jgi:hypothetical protein